MQLNHRKPLINFICYLLIISMHASAEQLNPNLAITQKDILNISQNITQIPLAQKALVTLVKETDKHIASPPVVPIPKDAGGGFTHEQHKRNYKLIYDLGLLYQITENKKYLDYAKSIFLIYADIYPTLGIHPKRKEQSPGVLFWQSLNEAMWLFYAIQGYDMIISSLSSSEKNIIEQNLLIPMADFLSSGQPETFNKIHNHGTWAVSAVGMTGYTLNNNDLVTKALYGLDKSGDSGFYKQIDELFSPDGYYAEGPYYQRFALLPFVIFAKSINTNDPNLKIFEYKDNALIKAIYTTIQLSYNKLFFPINDAIKDKGIDTIELVHSVAIAYDINKDPSLLTIAKLQNHLLLTGYGFNVAKALDAKLEKPFIYKSLQLRDGIEGDMGALSVFRNGFESGHQALVMKNTSHGLGHGHFDKMHWLFYDNNNEIISDYGAARFLNIEAKYGGHYLPENNKWAKQTIAHNTVVLNESSQFNGDWHESQKTAPEILFFKESNLINITSSKLMGAYKDSVLTRTMAMINLDFLEHPLIVDIFDIKSKHKNQYDLPLHYQGHLISHSGKIQYNPVQEALGKSNGYEYIWNKGTVALENGLSQMTWLNTNRFYTYSTMSNANEKFIFSQIGANDESFNLRNENLIIHRVPSSKNHTFVSVLETHGEYNPRLEFTKNAKSSIVKIEHSNFVNKNIIKLHFINGDTYILAISAEGDWESNNYLNEDNINLEWQGHFTFFKSN